MFDVIDVHCDCRCTLLSVHHPKILYGFRRLKMYCTRVAGSRSSMDVDPKHYVDGLKAHVPQNRYLSGATFFLLRYFSSLLGGHLQYHSVNVVRVSVAVCGDRWTPSHWCMSIVYGACIRQTLGKSPVHRQCVNCLSSIIKRSICLLIDQPLMHLLIIAVKGVFPADQKRSKWRSLVWLQIDKKMNENWHSVDMVTFGKRLWSLIKQHFRYFE